MNLSKNEMVALIEEQKQELKLMEAQLYEAKKQLDEAQKQQMELDLKISEAGTLAEASAIINNLFGAAQSTANTYIENVKKCEARASEIVAAAEKRAAEIIEEAEKKADGIVAQADDVYEKRIAAANMEVEIKSREAAKTLSEAEETANKRLAETDVEVEKKWSAIEDRLLDMYETHKGLKELVGDIFSPSKEQ